MSKNQLKDLNDHLFAQLERLGVKDLKGEDLQEEIQRSEAITNVSKEVVANATLVLKAVVAQSKSVGGLPAPSLLSIGED